MSSLADVVLVVHFLWVLGILLPIPLIVIGARQNWSWIRNPVFRAIHFAMIVVVIFESLVGIVCPLTLWENLLRSGSERASYGNASFIEYWVGRILFYDFPSWVFIVIYLAVGVSIAALFWWVPPQRRR